MGIVALSLVALGVTCTASATAATSPAPNAAESSTMAHELKLRAEFGLPATESAAQAAHSSSTATFTDLGIPLTAAESAEIHRQNTLGRYVGQIADQGAKPGSFANVRVEKGDIVISMVADTTAAAAASGSSLAALVPSTNPVRFEPAS